MEKTKVIKKYTTIIRIKDDVLPVDESKAITGQGVYAGLNFTYHNHSTKEQWIESVRYMHKLMYNTELNLDFSIVEVVPVTIKID